MQHSFLKISFISVVMMGLTACNPVLRTHGYVAADDKPQQIEADTDTRATVLARLGSPSIKGTFDENTWYYLTSVRQRLAYLRPLTEERSITAITFNEDGQVTRVAEYGLENGQYVNLVNRKTPTRGKELSVLEQIFGTIGRVPISQIGGNRNDLPGGRGGPGR
jgi:outer membrane protein assembly factor BamE (lipoprotein component of BamABCDE complex)